MNQNDKTRIKNVKIMLFQKREHLNGIANEVKGDYTKQVVYHHLQQAIRRIMEAEENLKVVLDELELK